MVIRDDNVTPPSVGGGREDSGEGAVAESSPPTSSRLAPQPVNLVLEGGGVKGIGLVGAISVLEERGFGFVRVAGTSAGAIVGSLVAAGFNSTEMQELMAPLDYTKFRDASELERVLPLDEGLALWFHEGVYKGDYFHKWISEQLATKDKHTFGDLRTDLGPEIPDSQQYKLVVMASDVSQGQLVRLPWAFADPVHPRDGQLIADAVRASMDPRSWSMAACCRISRSIALTHQKEGPPGHLPLASSCQLVGKPTSFSTRSRGMSASLWPCLEPCRAGVIKCISTIPR